MMNWRRIFLLLSAGVLIGTVFFPWIVIESRNITVTGMQATGTTFGKPGLLSLIFATLILLFSFVPRVWAHRICLFAVAFNTGWILRNFILLSGCQGGECPQRQPAFYSYLIAGLSLLIAVLIQNVRLKQNVSPELQPNAPDLP